MIIKHTLKVFIAMNNQIFGFVDSRAFTFNEVFLTLRSMQTLWGDQKK